MITRKVFIGGNWKCNGSLKFLESHIKLLNELYFDNKKCDVVICPLSIHLMLLKPLVRKEIQLSAQNISHRGEGAFTGEIAANQVSNIGVNWTVVGQSERRNFFNETDEIVGEKVMLAQQSKLKVIACLGETLDDCELTYNNLPACFKHLEAIAKNVINWEDIVLVYNPVWAIGNKDSYDRDHIQKVHYELRNWIKTNVSEPVSNSVQIVYGGSVTSKIAKELIREEDIDGFLVGGASLQRDFIDIIDTYKYKV